MTTLDESCSSVPRRPVKGCGGGSTCTSVVEEEESLEEAGARQRQLIRRCQAVTAGRSAKAGTRGGGVDVGWRWVEVATSTGAAADGEGGSSLGEMVDSSRRVRV
jgi:hypothetical protein